MKSVSAIPILNCLIAGFPAKSFIDASAIAAAVERKKMCVVPTNWS